MQEIGEPIPASAIVSDVREALKFAGEIGYPVIVRPAFTLGGTAAGLPMTPKILRLSAANGIKASMIGQVLIEKSVAGWKEVEYEVLRDSRETVLPSAIWKIWTRSASIPETVLLSLPARP